MVIRQATSRYGHGFATRYQILVSIFGIGFLVSSIQVLGIVSPTLFAPLSLNF